jgi:hypothetical protein
MLGFAARLDPVRLLLESLIGLPFSWGVHSVGALLPFWIGLAIALAAGVGYWRWERRHARREIRELELGQTVEEVEAILGPAEIALRKNEGSLLVEIREYRQGAKHFRLRFVGRRLVEYIIRVDGNPANMCRRATARRLPLALER